MQSRRPCNSSVILGLPLLAQKSNAQTIHQSMCECLPKPKNTLSTYVPNLIESANSPRNIGSTGRSKNSTPKQSIHGSHKALQTKCKKLTTRDIRTANFSKFLGLRFWGFCLFVFGGAGVAAAALYVGVRRVRVHRNF